MRASLMSVMLVTTVAGGVALANQEQEKDIIFFRAGPFDPAAGQAGAALPLTFEKPIDVLGVEPLDAGEPVTGAPYSAEITTEIVQPLADGNRIERRSTSAVARDSQGRVRREQQVTAIGPILPQGDVRVVTISDPVARVHYALDAERQVATRSPLPFTKRIERVVATPPLQAAPAREARSESLGTREIEGVKAEGTRTTITIPAGAIGNQAPIDIVSERWHSPELQTVVFSRRMDPRFGETTYRLANIVRAEPPPELFQVPPDFTVEAGRPFGARVIQRAP